MAPVRANVASKRRDLVQDARGVEDSHRPEVDPDRYRPPTPEDGAHLIGCRVGREVPIKVGMPEQRVTHSSPNTPCLEPGLLQITSDLQHRSRRMQLGMVFTS